MTWQTLVQPVNLIYVLAFVAGTLLLVIAGISGFDSGPDHDIGHLDHDLDHDVDSDHIHFGLHSIFELLGIGRVPFSIALVYFLFAWTGCGAAANYFLGSHFPPDVYIWPSIVIATICAVFITNRLARYTARLFKFETYAISGVAFVGTEGTARYRITEYAGTATVYDKYKAYHEVECRTLPGFQPIPAGKTIHLTDWDATKQVYFAVSDEQTLLKGE